MKTWVKLDNAAKIFPSISNKSRTNLYSISFTLNEEIDPVTLQEALNNTIMRFKGFKMRLRKGFFWYYLEENRLMPMIYEENPYLLEVFDKYKSRGYLFRVSYYNNRISIEVFHSLTDGYGACQFMKSLVYTYLKLKNYEIDSEGKILLNYENYFEESRDSFQTIYNEKIKADRTENRGIHFKGTPYEDNWLGIITGIVSKSSFKKIIEKYDCSYTQFLAGAITYCASKVKSILESKDFPFQVFVPVDLRRMYGSKSLRNFSMVVKTSIKLNKELTLEEYIKMAKEQLIDRMSEEKLLPRIIGNIKSEKVFIMRIVPMFIKNIALKIGYAMMSTRADSFCISNLNNIDLPKDMEKYVEKIVFSNGAMKKTPLNMGVLYYKDNIYMTFTSSIEERDMQKEFFCLLSSLGLDVVVETNDLEV